jgi:hypothetical protein
LMQEPGKEGDARRPSLHDIGLKGVKRRTDRGQSEQQAGG